MDTSPRTFSGISRMNPLRWRPGAIVLDSLEVKEGADLWEGYKFGKFLGAGVQARVFEIVRNDGSQTGQVIKVAHADLGHKILNSPVIWISMEREWETGVQMRAALGVPNGSVPGFMRVDDCVAVTDSKGKAHFVGMVMERLVGWEVHKRLLSPGFHNIHYVREMLRQVFSALDRAQRAVGFHHADLGMRNIMEHYPTEYEPTSRPGGIAPGARFPDGERAPKGPVVEFKIIDYGVAAFDRVLARSAGGSRYRRTIARIRSVLAAPRVTFPSRNAGKNKGANSHIAPGAIELLTADSAVGKATHSWFMLPTSLKHRYLVKQTPRGAVPAPDEAEGEGIRRILHEGHGSVSTDEAPPNGSDAVSESSTGTETSSDENAPIGCIPWKEKRRRPKLTRDTAQVNPDTQGEAKIARQRMSPIEKAYRSFWRRKSDVFHILLSTGMALDNHIWPRSDEESVLRFMALVFHVTGVKIRASFSAATDASIYGSVYDVQEPEEMRDEGSDKRREKRQFGKHSSWRQHFRRFHMIMKAHIHPYNSGTLASEALVSPFFNEYEPRSLHEETATIPVADVFPSLTDHAT